MLPGGVEFATPMTDVADDECVVDAFTLPLDGGGGNDKLLTPAEVGPTTGGPHMISWWRPLHFRHNTAPLCHMSRQQTPKTQTCRF